MILRRIADAIREQNWFTVFIEFMIVVSGIFVGLQVDDWNQARKDRELARAYISQLIGEVEQEISEKTLALDRLILKRDGLLRIRAALSLVDGRNGLATAIADPGQFLIDIRRSTNFGWLAGEVYSPVFDEMTSSGALALVKEPDVRELITGYYHYLDLQQSRSVARVTGYAGAVYRLTPPELMAVDQLAPDEDILPLATSLDAGAVLKKFSEAGLDDLINAELSFTYFMERELQESRSVSEGFKRSLVAYLNGEAVMPALQLVG